MITVVIPYLHKAAKWDELKYALRSWDKHFQEDFTVAVIGPQCPEWLDKRYFVPAPYNPEKTKEENLGVVLRYACKKYREFIWSNDDILLMKDSCMDTLRTPYYLQEDFQKLKKTRAQMQIADRLIRDNKHFVRTGERPGNIPGMRNTFWQCLLAGTADKLREMKFTAYNAETHIPYVYDSAKMWRLACVMDVFSGKYLHHTAYFNVFEDYPVYKLGDNRLGRYGRPAGAPKREETEKARYLNFDNAGLCRYLKGFIEVLYGKDASRFEN